MNEPQSNEPEANEPEVNEPEANGIESHEPDRNEPESNGTASNEHDSNEHDSNEDGSNEDGSSESGSRRDSSPGATRSVLGSGGGRAIVALLLVLILGAIFNGGGAFLVADTHAEMLQEVSVYGILACGMTLVMVTGGIDLSVGSVLALVVVCCGFFCAQWEWPWWGAVPVCLLIGFTCGLVSGTLVAWRHVLPFMATLIVMVVARGLATEVARRMDAAPAIAEGEAASTTDEIAELVGVLDRSVLSEHLSVVTVIFLGCALVTWLVLAKHRWGRHLYAIGGNEKAARLSGIRVVRSKVLAYGLAGFLSAIAGICYLAQNPAGNVDAGMGFESVAIAMALVGGTSLRGGRGGIGLTLLGVLVLGYLYKILALNEVSDTRRLLLTGIIMGVAVLFQRRRG